MHRSIKTLMALALGASLTAAGAPALAQQNKEQKKQNNPEFASDAGSLSMAYPTGSRESSVLLIEAQVPREARVGQEYTYEVKLTNISDNLALENVAVYQKAGSGLEVTNTKLKSKPENKKESGNQQSGSSRQNMPGQKIASVPQLMPGQSATLSVTAIGDKEGAQSSCLAVDYHPVLCLKTNFVKPDIQLTKSAPEKVGICDEIVYTYTVKNTGSGATKNLTIRDPLPEGLRTMDGEKEVSIDVGTLQANQSRDFRVELTAQRTGEFSSRAVAEAGELSVQSSKPTTRVVQADIQVEANAPAVQTVGEAFDYRVTVKNNGSEVAEAVILTADMFENLKMVRESVKHEEGDGFIFWALGDLKPQEQREIWIRAIGLEKGKIQNTFIAGGECARDRDTGIATTVASTEIIAVPALLLAAYDNEDPISTDENVLYTIEVINQGSAPAKNVQVVANLPEELEFQETSGPTDAKADGQKVTFNKLKELAPGENAEWYLNAKAKQAADVKLKVELSSDYLTSPATAQEPTRLFDPQKGLAGRSGQSKQRASGSGPDQQAQSANQESDSQNQNSGSKDSQKSGPEKNRKSGKSNQQSESDSENQNSGSKNQKKAKELRNESKSS